MIEHSGSILISLMKLGVEYLRFINLPDLFQTTQVSVGAIGLKKIFGLNFRAMTSSWAWTFSGQKDLHEPFARRIV